jgi:hypothetical protein
MQQGVINLYTTCELQRDFDHRYFGDINTIGTCF